MTRESTEDDGAKQGAGPRGAAWDRRRHESAQAYEAFLAFRDCGERRTLRAAAETVGKSRAMLARWSARHNWSDRVFAWDLEQRREAEAALRVARREALERQARDAEQLQRLGMARLAKLVSRDPVTGDARLDESVSPRDAVAVYRLGLEIADRLEAAGRDEGQAEEDTISPELSRMATEELHQLLALARERAGKEPSDGDPQESGDGS